MGKDALCLIGEQESNMVVVELHARRRGRDRGYLRDHRKRKIDQRSAILERDGVQEGLLGVCSKTTPVDRGICGSRKLLRARRVRRLQRVERYEEAA